MYSKADSLESKVLRLALREYQEEQRQMNGGMGPPVSGQVRSDIEIISAVINKDDMFKLSHQSKFIREHIYSELHLLNLLNFIKFKFRLTHGHILTSLMAVKDMHSFTLFSPIKDRADQTAFDKPRHCYLILFAIR